MSLEVQQFLEKKSFKDLQIEHGVYQSFSKDGTKFSLNYDMLESKDSDFLAQQCRGLILSHKDGLSYLDQAVTINGRINYDHVIPGETVVIARPMDRFFNAGQGAEANIDWSKPGIKIMEKLDGSCLILYYSIFSKSWHAATRSMPDADLIMDNGLFTFRTLFEKALSDSLNLTFDQFTSHLNPWLTYCFELTTPLNQIVCHYPNYSITLLAARNTCSGREFDIHNVDVYPETPRVKSYNFSSLQETVDWVSNQNPLEHEGVVIMDAHFNRIKVKNALYVAYSKTKDRLGASLRNCLELILAEKQDDIIGHLPPILADNLKIMEAAVRDAFNFYNAKYLEIQHELKKSNLCTAKDFALALKRHKIKWESPLFQMNAGKAAHMRDFVNNSRKDGTWNNSFLDKVLEIIEDFKK
jgi:hypothetical protein